MNESIRRIIKMPITVEEWRNNQRPANRNRNTKYAPEDEAALLSLADALDNMRKNGVLAISDKNDAFDKLDKFSSSIKKLANASSELASLVPGHEIVKGKFIIADEDEATDRFNEAMNDLNEFGSIMQRDLKDLLLLGTADRDAQNNVDIDGVFEGFETLSRLYGIDIPMQELKKEAKAYFSPEWIINEYDEKYSSDNEIEDINDYNDELDAIDTALNNIHTNHRFVPDVRMLEFSSPEHERLVKAADRLKKAFADPDLKHEPAEKLAAIAEAKEMGLAYRKQKNDDGGYSTNMGETRYIGAGNLVSIADALSETVGKQLTENINDIAKIKTVDPLLSNNDALLQQLGEIDKDLNARHRTGLFSGSSREHKWLCDAVNELKSALNVTTISEARKNKYYALKKAKAMAENYVHEKKYENYKSDDDTNFKPASRMGRKRYEAALKIIELADTQIEAMRETIQTKTKNMHNNTKVWYDTLDMPAGAKVGPLRKLRSDKLIAMCNNASHLENEVFSNIPNNQALNREFDENTVNKDAHWGLQFRSLMSNIGNVYNRKYENLAICKQEWDTSIENIKAHSKNGWLKDMGIIDKIFTVCDKTSESENGKTNFSELFVQTLEDASRELKIDLNANAIRERYNKHLEMKKAEELSRPVTLDDWTKTFPCDPDSIEDMQITDPKTIENINDLENIFEAVDTVNANVFMDELEKELGTEFYDEFSDYTVSFSHLFLSNDSLTTEDSQDKWNSALGNIKPFKDLLCKDDNYNKVMEVADKVSAQMPEHLQLDFRNAINTIFGGLNDHLNAGINIPQAQAEKANTVNAGSEPAKENKFDLSSVVTTAQESIKTKKEQNINDYPDAASIEDELKAITAAHLIKKSGKSCTEKDFEAMMASVGAMPEFSNMKTFENSKKIFNDAVTGDGAVLYDTVMKQHKAMHEKDKNTVITENKPAMNGPISENKMIK